MVKLAGILAIAAVGVLVAAMIVFSILFYLRPIAVTRWLRRRKLIRAGFREIMIPTSVGPQTALHGGRGAVVVLMHGAGDEAGTWFRVAPALKEQFHVLVLDFAGHGNSAPAAGVLSFGTLQAALEEVLATNSWASDPLILVGNSMGAWMATLYAHRHPERVQQLVLVDGGPLRNVSSIGLTPKTREEAARTMDAVLDPSTPKRPGFVLDDLVRVSNSGPIARLLGAGDDDISKYLLDGKIGEIKTPTDLIWGASDGLVPLSYAKQLQEQLPNCTLTVIERCGHAPQLERPNKFNEVLLQVLHSRREQEAASARGVQ